MTTFLNFFLHFPEAPVLLRRKLLGPGLNLETISENLKEQTTRDVAREKGIL